MCREKCAATTFVILFSSCEFVPDAVRLLSQSMPPAGEGHRVKVTSGALLVLTGLVSLLTCVWRIASEAIRHVQELSHMAVVSPERVVPQQQLPAPERVVPQQQLPALLHVNSTFHNLVSGGPCQVLQALIPARVQFQRQGVDPTSANDLSGVAVMASMGLISLAFAAGPLGSGIQQEVCDTGLLTSACEALQLPTELWIRRPAAYQLARNCICAPAEPLHEGSLFWSAFSASDAPQRVLLDYWMGDHDVEITNSSTFIDDCSGNLLLLEGLVKVLSMPAAAGSLPARRGLTAAHLSAVLLFATRCPSPAVCQWIAVLFQNLQLVSQQTSAFLETANWASAMLERRLPGDPEQRAALIDLVHAILSDGATAPRRNVMVSRAQWILRCGILPEAEAGLRQQWAQLSAGGKMASVASKDRGQRLERLTDLRAISKLCARLYTLLHVDGPSMAAVTAQCCAAVASLRKVLCVMARAECLEAGTTVGTLDELEECETVWQCIGEATIRILNAVTASCSRNNGSSSSNSYGPVNAAGMVVARCVALQLLPPVLHVADMHLRKGVNLRERLLMLAHVVRWWPSLQIWPLVGLSPLAGVRGLLVQLLSSLMQETDLTTHEADRLCASVCSALLRFAYLSTAEAHDFLDRLLDAAVVDRLLALVASDEAVRWMDGVDARGVFASGAFASTQCAAATSCKEAVSCATLALRRQLAQQQAPPDSASPPSKPAALPSWDRCVMDTMAQSGSGDSSCAPFFGCCYAGCTNFSGSSEADLRLRMCGGCGLARYCDEKCQRRAWRGGHRASCQAHQARDGYHDRTA